MGGEGGVLPAFNLKLALRTRTDKNLSRLEPNRRSGCGKRAGTCSRRCYYGSKRSGIVHDGGGGQSIWEISANTLAPRVPWRAARHLPPQAVLTYELRPVLRHYNRSGNVPGWVELLSFFFADKHPDALEGELGFELVVEAFVIGKKGVYQVALVPEADGEVFLLGVL